VFLVRTDIGDGPRGGTVHEHHVHAVAFADVAHIDMHQDSQTLAAHVRYTHGIGTAAAGARRVEERRRGDGVAAVSCTARAPVSSRTGCS